MGKIRTRILGYEEVEKEQIEEQKKRSLEKKMEKNGTSEAEETAAEGKEPRRSNAKKSKTVKLRVRGKKYLGANKKVDHEKIYSLADGLELLKKVKYAGFDESIEVHLNVAQDGLRGEVSLPHSTGKTVRVRIVDDTLLADLEKGLIEFDVLITHPSYMPKLAKYARTLGPKGLMPNPKAGTITDKPEVAAAKFEKGTLRWKSEAKFPLIHQMVGKSSIETEKLSENIAAFIKVVGKGNIKQAFISTTMGPSVQIDIEKI